MLETRQPYLSDMQRRAVLYTTALDSGYPILDDSKGWGRLDLVSAADGYGAFIGDVTVNMDARKGGFHARDWWYNDISGAGKLTKQGSGSLHLAGNNSYRGGSLIEQGRIVAESAHALGSGDVYLLDGGLSVALSEPLNIAGHFTQEGGILKLVPGADFTPVNVVKQLFIEGGELHLDLSALDLNAGDAIPLIEAGQRYGEFTRVDAGDIELLLEYRNQAVIAHIL
ncbi:autotransporter-associated beta strand repeat-containing protein [Agarivorans sp. QJM3NY_33]|uniref:autotransporter-associated beta strand repeat-containing protein n=1 Tax=Agarivorans sp. QJM3NY_33 TaxID=3421432 RepID=UPI003D7EA48A